MKKNFYNGNGYSKGLEFLVQKKFGSFNGWVSYTLGETKNKFDIYGSEYFSANQDITHMNSNGLEFIIMIVGDFHQLGFMRLGGHIRPMEGFLTNIIRWN